MTTSTIWEGSVTQGDFWAKTRIIQAASLRVLAVTFHRCDNDQQVGERHLFNSLANANTFVDVVLNGLNARYPISQEAV